MIQGFSNNSPNIHSHAHEDFDAAMPMPFKIPIVLATLLDPQTQLDFTQKQEDLMEALRFSYKAKLRLFKKMAVEEQSLLHEMKKENADLATLKEEYEGLQTHKMEASEVFFDILNALSEDLQAPQYQKLMEMCNIKI